MRAREEGGREGERGGECSGGVLALCTQHTHGALKEGWAGSPSTLLYVYCDRTTPTRKANGCIMYTSWCVHRRCRSYSSARKRREWHLHKGTTTRLSAPAHIRPPGQRRAVGVMSKETPNICFPLFPFSKFPAAISTFTTNARLQIHPPCARRGGLRDVHSHGRLTDAVGWCAVLRFCRRVR